jgi:hypothetical protein
VILDKTKPYGLIYGDPKLRFEQEGHLYDWNGEPVGLDAVVVHHTDIVPKTRSEIMKDAWARRKGV